MEDQTAQRFLSLKRNTNMQPTLPQNKTRKTIIIAKKKTKLK